MVAGIPPSLRTGIPLAHFAGIRTIRLDTLEASRPSMLPIAQTGVEAVLGARAAELGAVIRRGVTVAGLDQDASGVTVSDAGGRSWRAGWLVGCDGGRSTVRKLAGFGFPGSDPTITGRLVEVAVPDVMADPEDGVAPVSRRDPPGAARAGAGRRVRRAARRPGRSGHRRGDGSQPQPDHRTANRDSR
jgi:2-polyprenyl-6-methoxyphenol hydroxylase-like FAD-dependent oxidoreductase